jgi:hypothetical protein
MQKLIDNQTIGFDVHIAGDGQPVSISGLHMHKRMNGKQFKGVDVLFPLEGDGDIIFRPSSTKNALRNQLMTEIRRVISKDVAKRKELVKVVMEEIQRYSNGMPSKEQIQKIRNGALRIADVFSKNSVIEQEMTEQIESHLKLFVTKHKKEDGKMFYIKQDFLRTRIKVSDDLEELFKVNDIKWLNEPPE